MTGLLWLSYALMCVMSVELCLVAPHDDRVMALAMANQMRQYAFMPEFTLKELMNIGLLIGLEICFLRWKNLMKNSYK